MQFKENIEVLCGKADDPRLGYAQITIDFFQEFEEEFLSYSRDLSENPIGSDEVGSHKWFITKLLDVIDKTKFAKDVALFEAMYIEIGKWSDNIRENNKILGIPWHKG